MKMDEDYLVVGAHIDELTKAKIVKGEYVDFSKLLPRDRIATEEDGRMELIIKNGKTYWTPVTETVSINGFSKWEKAFRVFSNIYTTQYPAKASELIQYNHIIHSIAATYSWDNVNAYDKEFRMHLSKHPEHSWAVILQQAWSMKLCDRLNRDHQGPGSWNNSSGNHGSHNDNQQKVHDACKSFNKGKCNFGVNCRYEHKCSYCGKFGHTVLTCRKLQADKERAGKTTSYDHATNRQQTSRVAETTAPKN